MLIPNWTCYIMKKDISNTIIDLDKSFTQKNGVMSLNESSINGVPIEVAARLDLVNVYGLNQSTVDSMTTDMVLTEHAKYINGSPVKNININTILTEWSWRCEKGYPDYNNISDRLQLQEVLDEMKIALPFKRITEAAPKIPALSLFPDSLIQKFEKANKLDKFVAYLKLFPGGDALQKVADGIAKICVNAADETTLVEIFKSKKDLESILNIDLKSGIYARMYNIRPSGTGPGEILISWYVEGAMFQGGTVSYDIDYNGQHWEVKSLITSKSTTPESIDPANYGKIANYKFTQQFQSFFESIIDPYYDNKLRDAVIGLTDNKTVATKLTEILDIVESIPRYTASGKNLLSKSIGEMTPLLFDKFYNGITQIHGKLPKSVTDTAKASRIAVKTSTTDAQYWIDPDDVNDITKNAGKDTEISIKVGAKIDDENKEAKIWLARLMNSQFIKNPKYFIDNLKSIRDGFSEGKEGMIYLTYGKFNITYGMDDFFTSSITRATFRFDLKGLKKFANFKYAQEQ